LVNALKVQENKMINALLVVLCTLAIVQVGRAGFYRAGWGMDARLAFTLLLCFLIAMAFANGFMDA
jgi:hypothetical protein